MQFRDFGFKKFINNTLDQLNFNEPTKIQKKVIPLLKKYQSVIAQSKTGTGKTLAFLLPILNNLDFENLNRVQAVIITPTRELARQIYLCLKNFVKNCQDIKASLFVGGDDLLKQINSLKNQPTFVIGTPTRLKKLYDEKALFLTTAKYIVLDECDMIFELGFIEEVDFIMSKVNKQTITSLFSATISNELKNFLKKYFNNSIFINIVDKNPVSDNVENILIWTKNKENKMALKIVVDLINPYICIIFVNQKNEINEVVKWLNEWNIKNVGQLHGELSPRSRANMQKRIQNLDFKWIVATDIAARGIDIDGVSHVISIDLPYNLEYYIHRSGRAGRKKYTGQSIVLFNSQNQDKINKLKAMNIIFINKKIEGNNIVNVKNKKNQLHKTSNELDLKSKLVVESYKNKKIKPCYKKKRKLKLENIKKEHRRQNIKKSISKIKKEKREKRRKELFLLDN